MDSIEIPAFVNRLYNYDLEDDCPFHVAIAVLRVDKWGRRRIVSGRGGTPLEAASRCLFEATERHAAIFDEARELTWGSQASLGSAAVKARSLLLISDHQYAHRSDWNRRFGPDHEIPPQFDDDRNLAWIPARSLVSQNMYFVPAASCFLGYPQALEDGFPVPDSSGLAFGHGLVDAIDRAFLEIVERDAVSIWWYGRVVRPAIEPHLQKSPLWQSFATWMNKSNRSFWVLDLAHDFGIPVAAAVSCNAKGSDLSFGFAAASTSEAAAQSAMGELVQFEVTKRLLRQADDRPVAGFLKWCASAQVDENCFLMPGQDARRAPVSGSAKSVIDVELLRTRGCDALVVEFPHERQNESVVRVLVPGLRCIWPRFAPGRLYDVPVSLAWHERRLTESELNPVPILY